MLRLRLIPVVLCVLLGLPLRAADGFTSSLSPEEFRRAGLEKLTPKEREALDELVRRSQEPVAQAAAASQAARDARKYSSASNSTVVKVKPGTRVVEDALQSRIDGKFQGWEGRAIFKLKNGQRWQIANPGPGYWCPPVQDPKVTITPSSLGGYWMVIEDVEVRVRVKPLD